MSTGVVDFTPFVEGAAIFSVHDIILFHQADSTFLSQGVVFWPPALQFPGYFVSYISILKSPDMGA